MNTKVTVIKIKYYHLKKILIKLDNTQKASENNLKRSSEDDTDEERVIHSKSDNIEIMISLKQMKL